MLRYEVTLVFDNVIIARAMSDDLTESIRFVLSEAAKSSDLVASRVPNGRVGRTGGQLEVLTHHL